LKLCSVDKLQLDSQNKSEITYILHTQRGIHRLIKMSKRY